MNKVLRNPTALQAIMAFFCFLAALHLFSSFARVPVNPDAGYYLSIAKEVMEGATPTVGVATSYPPGVYYIYAAWFKLFGTGYSKALLLLYLIHVLNCVLLYTILTSFVQERIIRIILCFSYFYSTMLLEGYYIALEPFEITFVLLAYLAYLKDCRPFATHALTGFFLGCSFMVKQYSLLVLFGFLAAFWCDYRKKERPSSIAIKMLITAVFFSLPYVLFVVFTDATLATSLHSFAYLRKSPILYAMQGGADPLERARDVLSRMGQMNWLFIPFALHVYKGFSRKNALWHDKTVVPIFLASTLPILVRQYGHYFQLIAPWSFILLGLAAGPAARRFLGRIHMQSLLMLALSASLFVILPAFIGFTPSFYTLPKITIGLVTLLFLCIVAFALLLGIHFSRVKIDSQAVLFVLSAVVVFETLFLGLKLPLNDLEQRKKTQIAEATEINRRFPPGSPVFIIDYPELYVTGDFRNPLHDFDLTFLDGHNAAQKLKTLPWDKVDFVASRRNSALISPERLRELGYRLIRGPSEPAIDLYVKG